MAEALSILFAGGGTGGHIYPNLAVWEQVRKQSGDAAAQFVVSNRELDARVMGDLTAGEDAGPVNWSPLSVRPLSMHPRHWPQFYAAWRSSVATARRLVREHQINAVVGTGGFVSGPAFAAAKKEGIRAAMVNLDAVPGKANRMLAGRVSKVFTVYESPALPGAERIGLPLPGRSIGPEDVDEARRTMGVDPISEVLLIVGGSSGAQSINRMMLSMIKLREVREALIGWQIVHLAGPNDAPALRHAYKEAGLAAMVEPYCQTMGAAWRAATIAVSRAGAGSVAEVWANRCPTIFMPYPFHKDQHQRLNAQPLVTRDAAVMVTDRVDAQTNARHVSGELLSLMVDSARRRAISDALKQTCPVNGADRIASWLMDPLQGFANRD